jgi:hypothetical protein
MPRRRLFLLTAVTVTAAAAVAVAPASAGDPLKEQIQLTRADNALASRVSLQASDLATGWTLVSRKFTGNGNDSCPSYQPDFSSVTVTGHQERSFRIPAQPLAAASLVEVYATVAQTETEWRLSMTKGAMQCWGSAFNAKDGSMRLVSSRLLRGSRLGDASAKFAFVMSVRSASGPVAVHMELLAVRKGRVIVGLFTASPVHSVPGQELVLARMVGRI